MCIRDRIDCRIFQQSFDWAEMMFPVSYTHLDVYKRQTMTQTRLNHVALFYVHKLDDIDYKKIANIFISNVDDRGNVFGTFYD